MKFDKFDFINDKELFRLTGIKQATFNKIKFIKFHNFRFLEFLF
ncbi:hypothetical protein [Spiroplasma sp. Moj]